MSLGERRVVVFALILAAHGLLGWVLQQGGARIARTNNSDRTFEPASAVIFERTPPVLPPFPNKSFGDQLPSLMRRHDPIAIQVEPITIDAEPTHHGPIDWSSEARAAARDIVAGIKSAKGSGTDQVAGKAGVFGSQAENHRAGMVEGGSRYWVTDDCYYDFPRGLPPPARLAGEFHLLTRTCKHPPTGGGAEMFDALKPESLRAPIAPERAPNH